MNPDIEIDKFFNESFAQNIHTEPEDLKKYTGYIKNMLPLISELIKISIKDKSLFYSIDNGTENLYCGNKELETLIEKLVDVENYINVTEFKYYIIDEILRQTSMDDEVDVVDSIDKLFKKYMEL